jgi:hypothetical protein
MSFHLDELLSRVEESADWRDQKAAEYPNDKRNSRSSEALKTLAQNLGSLPPETAATYENLMDRAVEHPNALYRISEVEQRYISRYGFDYPQDGNPAPFLEGLTEEVAEIVEDAEGLAKEDEDEAKYEAAEKAADEAAKEAARQAASGVAEEAATAAAEKAYKKTYEETYREVYGETYKKALIEALAE